MASDRHRTRPRAGAARSPGLPASTALTPHPLRITALLDAGALYMVGLLDEASVLINSSRDPSNLEAPIVLTWLRASGDTLQLGARRIWAEFRKNTAAAAQFRRAASFITDMPEVLEASGVGAFTYHGDHGDKFLPDKRHCGDERKSRRQLAREREAARKERPQLKANRSDETPQGRSPSWRAGTFDVSGDAQTDGINQ